MADGPPVSQTQTRARVYRSDLRQQQAAQTRRRVVEAAVDVFGERGYQATTFAQLADQAGVSVETVQKHGPKAALMWAAVEFASFGVEGEADFFNTDLGKALLEIRDPNQLAQFAAASTLAVNEPSAAVWIAFTEAANGDPELRALLDGRLAGIRRQTERILGVVAARGWLRTDIPFDDLVEAHCVLTSIETYVRFVHLDGKSREQYAAFIGRTLRDSLLAR
jgi:AcrR family transcriptional regulator